MCGITHIMQQFTPTILYAIPHHNTLQRTTTRCNMPQHTSTYVCDTTHIMELITPLLCSQYNTTTHWNARNTLQHTATHCNIRVWHPSHHGADYPTPLYATQHCNTLQHTATQCTTMQHSAHCNTLQHTATHCNTLQHTATHCST